jgi:hypothetical protein
MAFLARSLAQIFAQQQDFSREMTALQGLRREFAAKVRETIPAPTVSDGNYLKLPSGVRPQGPPTKRLHVIQVS